MNHCMRHYEETIAGHCRSCGQPFCSRCLVYAFGPKKPPYCVGCALYASGVRSGTRHVVAPVMQQVIEVPETEISPSAVPGTVGLPAPVGAVPVQDKRAERAYRRAQRTAEKQAVKAAKKTARRGVAPAEPEPVATDLPPTGRMPATSARLTAHEPV